MLKSGKPAGYRKAGLPWEYCAGIERGITFLDCYFVLYIVHVLLNTERSISVWDFVKFSINISRTLNQIRIFKIWFEPLSADYRLLYCQFRCWKRLYWCWITISKYWKHFLSLLIISCSSFPFWISWHNYWATILNGNWSRILYISDKICQWVKHK